MSEENLDVKLPTTDARRNYLVSEPNYHTSKVVFGDSLAIEIKKKRGLMNELVLLGLPLLEINETVIFEFWHDNVKPKYRPKANFCYMVTT